MKGLLLPLLAGLGIVGIFSTQAKGATGNSARGPRDIPVGAGEQWLLTFSFSRPLADEGRAGFSDGFTQGMTQASHQVEDIDFLDALTASAVVTYGAPAVIQVGRSIEVMPGLSATVKGAAKL